MRYYPLFLDLSHAFCLVVGVGGVGRRKIATLLECGVAGVAALDPYVEKESLSDFLKDPRFTFEQRDFQAGDVRGKRLVFVCTSSREINKAVTEVCKREQILCNIADATQESDFLVPSHVEVEPLTLALSTGGASPALARALKTDLETWLTGRYVPLARFLKKLRPVLLGLGMESKRNAEVFRALCAPDFRTAFCAAVEARDNARVLQMVKAVVPAALHDSLKELVNGLD